MFGTLNFPSKLEIHFDKQLTKDFAIRDLAL